jgi:hypothetical protein
MVLNINQVTLEIYTRKCTYTHAHTYTGICPRDCGCSALLLVGLMLAEQLLGGNRSDAAEWRIRIHAARRRCILLIRTMIWLRCGHSADKDNDLAQVWSFCR